MPRNLKRMAALLFTILSLGLAACLYLGYGNTRNRASSLECSRRLRMIGTGLCSYYHAHGHYPASASSVEDLLTEIGISPDSFRCPAGTPRHPCAYASTYEVVTQPNGADAFVMRCPYHDAGRDGQGSAGLLRAIRDLASTEMLPSAVADGSDGPGIPRSISRLNPLAMWRTEDGERILRIDVESPTAQILHAPQCFQSRSRSTSFPLDLSVLSLVSGAGQTVFGASETSGRRGRWQHVTILRGRVRLVSNILDQPISLEAGESAILVD